MIARVTLAVVAIALLGIAPAAWAVDPVPGIYPPYDVGGEVVNGRVSLSWEQPLNAMQGVGDVLWAYSTPLGPTKCGSRPCEQWILQCPLQSAPQVVEDLRDGAGTGAVIRTGTLFAGTFFLHRSSAWGDGTSHFTGTLVTTQVVVTEHHVEGVLQDSDVALHAMGSFDGSSCLMTFDVAAGTVVGDSDHLPWPLPYPEPMAPDCAGLRNHGWWGDLNRITVTIECPTPASPSTWGRVKVLYR